jgi:hypothetical protein
MSRSPGLFACLRMLVHVRTGRRERKGCAMTKDRTPAGARANGRSLAMLAAVGLLCGCQPKPTAPPPWQMGSAPPPPAAPGMAPYGSAAPPPMAPAPYVPPPPPGPAPSQQPLLDRATQIVVAHYQNSSCEQLAQERGRPLSQRPQMEQNLVQVLRNDPPLRAQFLDRVAPPVANRLFECGLIP